MVEKDIEEIYNFYSDSESLKYVPRNLFTEMDQAAEKVKFLNKLFEDKSRIWWGFAGKKKE